MDRAINSSQKLVIRTKSTQQTITTEVTSEGSVHQEHPRENDRARITRQVSLQDVKFRADSEETARSKKVYETPQTSSFVIVDSDHERNGDSCVEESSDTASHDEEMWRVSSDTINHMLVSMGVKVSARMVSYVLERLLTRTTGSSTETGAGDAQSASDPTHNASSSIQTSGGHTSSQEGQKSKTGKRARDGGKDPGDDGSNSDSDENSDEDRKRKKGKGPIGSKPHWGLRCPFFLKDPELYGKSLACSSGRGFADMTRLRYHLKRAHTLPIRCPRCWKEMKTEDARVQHLRKSKTCELLPDPQDDRISPEQWEKIESMKSSTKQLSPYEKWKALYQTLFPGEWRIPSPCDKPVLMSQLEVALADALEEELMKEFASQIGPVLDRIKARIPAIIRKCAARLESRSQAPSRRLISEPISNPIQLRNLHHENEQIKTPDGIAKTPRNDIGSMLGVSMLGTTADAQFESVVAQTWFGQPSSVTPGLLVDGAGTSSAHSGSFDDQSYESLDDILLDLRKNNADQERRMSLSSFNFDQENDLFDFVSRLGNDDFA